jgi:nitroimidazol reductase NimA-like FMN-containing flavoprotein (pyridoxamine 5'-phosphate oxidase superfamily)
MSTPGKAWTILSAVAFVVIPVVYYQVYQRRQHEAERRRRQEATLSSIARTTLKPPFPQIVRDMLSKCRLAYLSTVDEGAMSSHLSLMRFTYFNDPVDGEVVILSTNKKTKKFGMLQQQSGVALLVHDFSQGQKSDSCSVGCGAYSITLNGTCRIVTDAIKSQHYRQLHLKHNPDYPQFIVGDDISILCVDVVMARICDINDHVAKWDVAENSTDGISAM